MIRECWRKEYGSLERDLLLLNVLEEMLKSGQYTASVRKFIGSFGKKKVTYATIVGGLMSITTARCISLKQ